MKQMVYKMEHIKDVLYKGEKDGYIIVIMSYGFHPCAYIGLPKTHKFYGLHYNDIDDINCHFGLTFSEQGNDKMPWIENEEEKELWWIGWDYAHCNDYAPYYDEPPFSMSIINMDMELHKWTTEEILDECYDVVEQLKDIEI